MESMSSPSTPTASLSPLYFTHYLPIVRTTRVLRSYRVSFPAWRSHVPAFVFTIDALCSIVIVSCIIVLLFVAFSLYIYLLRSFCSTIESHPLCSASLSICDQLLSVSHIAPKPIHHVSSPIATAKSRSTLSPSLIRFSLEDDLS